MVSSRVDDLIFIFNPQTGQPLRVTIDLGVMAMKLQDKSLTIRCSLVSYTRPLLERSLTLLQRYS